MVEDNSEIKEKIQRLPFIQDRRPHQFLPRDKKKGKSGDEKRVCQC